MSLHYLNLVWNSPFVPTGGALPTPGTGVWPVTWQITELLPRVLTDLLLYSYPWSHDKIIGISMFDGIVDGIFHHPMFWKKNKNYISHHISTKKTLSHHISTKKNSISHHISTKKNSKSSYFYQKKTLSHHMSTIKIYYTSLYHPPTPGRRCVGWLEAFSTAPGGGLEPATCF